jgi:hypothetical protein
VVPLHAVSERIPVEFVGSPAHLPKPPKGRVGILDIAFASGEKFDQVTEPYILRLGHRLALWCDHHEHAVGWARYRADPRFVLVPNREAHACPELVTPEVARRAGAVDGLLVHGDFDGLLTAVKLLRNGAAPYPEADEDARAIDSPGRGHALSERGARLGYAVDEAVATFTAGARRDFLTEVLWSLVAGSEAAPLSEQIERAARAAREAQARAVEIAEAHSREELRGVLVVRLAGRREGRQRKAILRWAEERAPAAVVVEAEGASTWLTAATFDPLVDLASIDLLQGGRSDYRYCEPRGPVQPILQAVARAVANR